MYTIDNDRVINFTNLCFIYSVINKNHIIIVVIRNATRFRRFEKRLKPRTRITENSTTMKILYCCLVVNYQLI